MAGFFHPNRLLQRQGHCVKGGYVHHQRAALQHGALHPNRRGPWRFRWENDGLHETLGFI